MGIQDVIQSGCQPVQGSIELLLQSPILVNCRDGYPGQNMASGTGDLGLVSLIYTIHEVWRGKNPRSHFVMVPVPKDFPGDDILVEPA